MSDDIIQLRDLVKIVKRNIVLAGVVVVSCTGLAVVAAFVVPPKYKSTATLNIPAAYFQIPLVSDLIAGVNDPGELRALRESLLRISLSSEFVDKLAEKHGLYDSNAGDRLRIVEREFFTKSLTYFAIGPTSYQISASGSTPEMALDITQSVLDQMVSTLISDRLSKITRAKNAIESNLNSLRVSMAGGGFDSGTSTMLREEVKKAEADLEMLQARFTPEHPTVVEQRRRTEALRERMGVVGGRGRGKEDAMSAGSKLAVQEMYDEFVRKFNNLNVVLDMEKDVNNVPYLSVIERPALAATPYFPKKRIFVLGGFAGGIVLALVIALFKELKRGTFMTPVKAAQVLDVPFLGTMPAWQTADAQILIEGYAMPSGPKQLSVTPESVETEKGKKKKG